MGPDYEGLKRLGEVFDFIKQAVETQRRPLSRKEDRKAGVVGR